MPAKKDDGRCTCPLHKCPHKRLDDRRDDDHSDLKGYCHACQAHRHNAERTKERLGYKKRRSY